MNVEITKLSNGLTVVTDPMPGLESAFVGVWVNAGGRNETRPVMGVSHMLEHMAFKGTQTRSARAIAEEIEAVGGYLNAYTSREQTAFHARVLRADVPLGIDLLSDILTHPTFEQAELERERQVVLQELGQARDTPDDIVFDHLQTTVYPDQPMGWPILGEEKTVSNYSQAELRAIWAPITVPVRCCSSRPAPSIMRRSWRLPRKSSAPCRPVQRNSRCLPIIAAAIFASRKIWNRHT